MKLFDLHCDTIDRLYEEKTSLKNHQGSVTLSGMKGYDKCVRCFAIWIDDKFSEIDANRLFCELHKVFKEQIKLFKDDVTEITDQESLIASKIGLILTLENGSALNGDVSNIEKFAKSGVKVITLTWNGENSLGFGQLENKGLKPFGKECIPILEQNNIVIDVSHLSEKGFDDVCALSKKPFIATHSNAKSITPHNRNLTDDQIREIIKRKGLIGLNLYRAFLNDAPEKASKYDVIRHAEHILSLGGEDVLAIGTDFDGAKVINELDNDKKLSKLEKFFIKNGFSSELTDKILYKNAENFFMENL